MVMFNLTINNSEDESAMSQRESDILGLVVSDYIHNAQPISSLYITDNHNVGCSSATIRSVLATLEQKRYLYSPHRSSGRIPTEKGYRFFVSSLPDTRYLDDEEKRAWAVDIDLKGM